MNCWETLFKIMTENSDGAEAMEEKMKIEKIYYMASYDGEPALVLERADRQFRMNSGYSPLNEVKSWAKQFKKDSIKKVACLFGLGTGLFAKALLDILTEDSRLIIFEPEKLIIDYCRDAAGEGEPAEQAIYERISQIINDKRVRLCVYNDDKLAFREQLFANLDYYMVEGMIVAKHTMYDRLYEEDYVSFLHTINEVRERIMVNKNTLARFRDNASKNVLTNMWTIEKMNLVSQLKEILPKEVPAIIVSAGPSLDKNVELLRKAKGHCLIFAVDTAIPYLLKRDIIPDLTVTVEPIKPIKHYLDPRSEEIPAVFDSESNPEIVGKHRDRVFIYNCRGYVKRLLEAVGKTVPEDVVSGGSVATAAFAILYELEMKNIILIGQDLAYSGEATHAGGVESKGINNEIGYEMVEDIYGNQVRTRSDWIGYLKWFESAISVIRDLKKDIRVIDATEGGAKIHGSEIMTLASALETFCGLETGDTAGENAGRKTIFYDFSEEIKKLPPFLNEEEYREFLCKKAESIAQLDTMKKQALKAAENCKKVIAAYEKEGLNAAAANKDMELELAQIRAYCESCYIYPMVNNYAVSDIAEEVSRLRLSEADDRQKKINEIMQKKLAFEAIANACEAIKGFDK